MQKQMVAWTPERLSALSPEELANLRANAVRKNSKVVVDLCDAEIARRSPVRVKLPRTEGAPLSRDGQFVAGYHFVCPQESGVTVNGDGTVWTGTWVVDRDNAERSAKFGGYVALHTAKSDPSYLQGKIKEWRRSKRNREYADGRLVKIQYGVDFLLELTNQPYRWSGEATGEKGYLWADEPK
jgi:hypothetical protein